MRTSGRKLWPLAGALGLVLALGGATALGGELKQRSSTEPVPVDSEPHSATATCPAGHKLTGGAGRMPAGGAIWELAGWYPLSKREWTASGINFLGDTSEVTAYAFCLRHAKVKLASESIELGPAQAVTATCPRRTKVSGGGLQVDPEGTANIIAASYPSGKREWTAVADPSSGTELTAHAVCLKDRKVKRKETTAEIPPGFELTAVTVTCKKRTKPTGGGAEIDPDETTYVASYPDGKRGWTVEAQSESGSELTAHVLCLKKQRSRR